MRLSEGLVVSFSMVMFVAGGAFRREFGEATSGDVPVRARLLAEETSSRSKIPDIIPLIYQFIRIFTQLSSIKATL